MSLFIYPWWPGVGPLDYCGGSQAEFMVSMAIDLGPLEEKQDSRTSSSSGEVDHTCAAVLKGKLACLALFSQQRRPVRERIPSWGRTWG